MKLSNFTTLELWKLYYQIGWEILKRQWWQFTLGILFIIVIYLIMQRKGKTNGN